MRGEYVDLHCHYLPGIDDGVKTLVDGVALCRGLHELGYARVVATPHIRTALFPNHKSGLQRAMAQFQAETDGLPAMPALGLGAEHFFDDVFWRLFRNGETVPYPGGHAALVELPRRALPVGLDRRLFEMRVQGLRPVLAHPERYHSFFSTSERLEPLQRAGVLPLLDLMSLVGRYGRRPRRTAERMLAEGVYYAACSDCHKPSDVDLVHDSIARLEGLIGVEVANELLSENPKRILEGRVER